MTMAEQVYTQALMLAGPLDARQEILLRMLCGTACRGLERRLRPNLTPSDCQSDFIGAAGLMALAALSEVDDVGMTASFRVGDLSVTRRDGSAAADCLRRQAMLLMAPYLQDRFCFAGV